MNMFSLRFILLAITFFHSITLCSNGPGKHAEGQKVSAVNETTSKEISLRINFPVIAPRTLIGTFCAIATAFSTLYHRDISRAELAVGTTSAVLLAPEPLGRVIQATGGFALKNMGRGFSHCFNHCRKSRQVNADHQLAAESPERVNAGGKRQGKTATATPMAASAANPVVHGTRRLPHAGNSREVSPVSGSRRHLATSSDADADHKKQMLTYFHHVESDPGSNYH